MTALGWAAAGVLVVVVILLFFYHRTMRPLRVILNGMDLLREQDFSSRLRKTGSTEADKIVDMFNSMIDELKEERLLLRGQNEFLDLLVKASPMGVVVLDYDHRIVQVNPAGESFLGVEEQAVRGMPLKGISPSLRVDIAEVPLRNTSTFTLSNGAIYKVTHSSFIDRGFARSFYLVEHLTEEVRRAEKVAYEKVIRMMAHEVNNSTAGITSILDTVSHAVEEPDLQEALGLCIERAYSMSGLISRFAEVVKIPKAILQPTSLNDLIRSQALVYETFCVKVGATLELELDETLPELPVDSALFEQVMLNVVKNATESITSDTGGRVLIRTSAKDRLVEVVDNGAAITKEVEEQLFQPFFSTKPKGQGVGLILIQDILRQHGFAYSLSTDPATQLTHFRVYLRS